MEGEVLVPVELLAHLRMLVSSAVVENHVNALAGGDLALDRFEESVEFSIAMSLHVAADYGAVEHI